MFVVKKAKKPKKPKSRAKEFKSLDRIASDLEPRYQMTLTRGINKVKGEVTPSSILKEVQDKDAQKILAKIPFDQLNEEFKKIDAKEYGKGEPKMVNRLENVSKKLTLF